MEDNLLTRGKVITNCPGFLLVQVVAKGSKWKIKLYEYLLMRLIKTKKFDKVRKSLYNHFIHIQPYGFLLFLRSEGISSISKRALATSTFSNDCIIPHANFNVPKRGIYRKTWNFYHLSHSHN